MYEGLYFCGKNFDQRLVNSIDRLADWTEIGFCYELSGLMTLILVGLGDTTARLNFCQLNEGVRIIRSHCFVEYLADGRPCIADPTYTSFPYVMPKEEYMKQLKRPEIKRSYAFSDLSDQNQAYIRKLAELIKNPDTSYIFKELQFFRPYFDLFGMPNFDNYLMETPEIGPETGKSFKAFIHAGKSIHQELFDSYYNTST